MSGVNHGYKLISKLYLCYISVCASKEDELFVAGTRASRYGGILENHGRYIPWLA